MEFTLEVYRNDKRKRNGVRRIDTVDIDVPTIEAAEAYGAAHYKNSDKVCIHKTYVTRVNCMTRKEFQERYDTPFCCSPASETYWSM